MRLRNMKPYPLLMLGGFVAGLVFVLLTGQAALPPGSSITVDSSTHTSQWIANTDGGITYDGGVEVGRGIAAEAFAAFLADAGIAMAVPATSSICLNVDAGCSITIKSGTTNPNKIVLSRGTSVGAGTTHELGNGNSLQAGTGSLTGYVRFVGNISNNLGLYITESGIPVKVGTLTNATANAFEVANDISLANKLLFSVGDAGTTIIHIADGGMALQTGIVANGGGAILLLGVPTTALPTCNAGLAGALQYNTTTNKHVGCNGTAWTDLY